MANIGWNPVSVSFNDSNQAMANAQRGFSQVGTVFGELRKSILDEEQRAVENAYKEKQLAENIRQFGLKHELDTNQFNENIRQFDENLLFNRDNLAETTRHNQATEKASMKSAEASAITANIAQQRWNQQQEDDKIMRKIVVGLTGEKNKREAELTDLKNKIENETDPTIKEILQTTYNTLKNDESLTATGLKHTAERRFYELTGRKATNGTPYDNESGIELKRRLDQEQYGRELSKARKQELAAAFTNINKLQTNSSASADDVNNIMSAVSQVAAMPEYQNIPVSVIADMIVNAARDRTAWSYVPFTDRSNSEYNNTLDTSTGSPIRQSLDMLAFRFAKGEERATLAKSLGLANNVPTPNGDTVTLKDLSDEGLDYREKQIRESLPKPEDVTLESPEVKVEADNLYRKVLGSKPKDQVSKSQLDSILQQAYRNVKNRREANIDRALRNITNERYDRNYDDGSSISGVNGIVVPIND